MSTTGRTRIAVRSGPGSDDGAVGPVSHTYTIVAAAELAGDPRRFVWLSEVMKPSAVGELVDRVADFGTPIGEG